MMGEKLDSTEIRKNNKLNVFQFLMRHGRSSTQDIVSALHLSRPTVVQVLRELDRQHLIRDGGVFESSGGRKARAFEPAYDAGFAIGADITKSHISFVLTDLSEKVIRSDRIQKNFENTPEYAESFRIYLRHFADSEPNLRERLLGVGISIPGIVDRTGTRIEISNLLGLHDMDYADLLHDDIMPVRFMNDANAAGMAEYFQNPGKTLFYLSLSDSVGGAVFLPDCGGGIVNDLSSNIYYGAHCHSAEVGHMVIHPDGERCYCGKTGCADVYCSAQRLTEAAGGSLERFFDRVAIRDPECCMVWDRYLDDLAILIDNIYMMFDCRIIVGGFVGSFMVPYMEELRSRLCSRNIFEDNADYVHTGMFRGEAAAFGAAVLYIEKLYNNI